MSQGSLIIGVPEAGDFMGSLEPYAGERERQRERESQREREGTKNGSVI
jgi:hypothetical protein